MRCFPKGNIHKITENGKLCVYNAHNDLAVPNLLLLMLGPALKQFKLLTVHWLDFFFWGGGGDFNLDLV